MRSALKLWIAASDESTFCMYLGLSRLLYRTSNFNNAYGATVAADRKSNGSLLIDP